MQKFKGYGCGHFNNITDSSDVESDVLSEKDHKFLPQGTWSHLHPYLLDVDKSHDYVGQKPGKSDI